MPHLSQSILACAHGTVQDHSSGDTRRLNPKPSGSFQAVFGPALTLPASSTAPALQPLPGQGLHTCLELSLQAKFPGLQARLGQPGPRQSYWQLWKRALGYGSWGEQRKNRPMGMASWGPFRSRSSTKVLVSPRKAFLTEFCLSHLHPHSAPSILFPRELLPSQDCPHQARHSLSPSLFSGHHPKFPVL